MALQGKEEALEQRPANCEMAGAINWHVSPWDPATLDALTKQEEGEHTLMLSPMNRLVPVAIDLTTSSASIMGTTTAGQDIVATPTPMDVISLESDQETIPISMWQSKKDVVGSAVMRTERPLVWHSKPYRVKSDGGDIVSAATPPASSDNSNLLPVAAEIIVISSSEDDVPTRPRTTVEPILISSNSSEPEDRAGINADYSNFDYDPAEVLPINKRKKHYYDLGRRMEAYTEMRLKRIVDHPSSSTEDFQEAQYQLHTRYPKHKRGRAVEAWRK